MFALRILFTNEGKATVPKKITPNHSVPLICSSKRDKLFLEQGYTSGNTSQRPSKKVKIMKQSTIKFLPRAATVTPKIQALPKPDTKPKPVQIEVMDKNTVESKPVLFSAMEPFEMPVGIYDISEITENYPAYAKAHKSLTRSQIYALISNVFLPDKDYTFPKSEVKSCMNRTFQLN